MRSRLTVIVLTVLVVGGCERGELITPERETRAEAVVAQQISHVARRTVPVRGPASVRTAVGPDGGQIELPGFTLTVPAGAVTRSLSK
jgi:hypothetical protein